MKRSPYVILSEPLLVPKALSSHPDCLFSFVSVDPGLLTRALISSSFYSLWGFVLEGSLVWLVLRVRGSLTSGPLQNSALTCRLSRVWKPTRRFSGCAGVVLQAPRHPTACLLRGTRQLPHCSPSLCFLQHSCGYDSGLEASVVCRHQLIFRVHEHTLSTGFFCRC